mgnify:FL=1
MKKEELEELEKEMNGIRYFISDIYDMTYVMEKIDNDSRDKIIDLLREKIVELKRTADSIMDVILLERKKTL